MPEPWMGKVKAQQDNIIYRANVVPHLIEQVLQCDRTLGETQKESVENQGDIDFFCDAINNFIIEVREHQCAADTQETMFVHKTQAVLHQGGLHT